MFVSCFFYIFGASFISPSVSSGSHFALFITAIVLTLIAVFDGILFIALGTDWFVVSCVLFFFLTHVGTLGNICFWLKIKQLYISIFQFCLCGCVIDIQSQHGNNSFYDYFCNNCDEVCCQVCAVWPTNLGFLAFTYEPTFSQPFYQSQTPHPEGSVLKAVCWKQECSVAFPSAGHYTTIADWQHCEVHQKHVQHHLIRVIIYADVYLKIMDSNEWYKVYNNRDTMRKKCQHCCI